MKKQTIEKLEHKVTLYFETIDAKEEFLGQLSDGWGENHVSLSWDTKEGDLYVATAVKVENIDCVAY